MSEPTLTEQQDLEIAKSILEPQETAEVQTEPTIKLTRKEKIKVLKSLIKDIKSLVKPGYELTPDDKKAIAGLEKELFFVRLNKYESNAFVFTPSPKTSMRRFMPKKLSFTNKIKEMFRNKEREKSLAKAKK